MPARSTDDANAFDYVVIGAGTAGCLLANRLSADPNARVLLLEAGGSDNYHWVHIPVGYLYLMGNPRADWGFKTAVEPGLGNRALNYPRGKLLGGCSSINGMIYMRGQARDYDLWRQMGNPGWAWEDVLPYFRAHEDQWAVEPSAFDGLHQRGGEWRVEQPRIRWAILDAFREAAAEAGIPKTDDFNRGDNEGCGYFHVNQKSGVRWNAAKGFLKPIRHRRNLVVETHALVDRIVLEPANGAGGAKLRASALVVRQKGHVRTFTARREIILAAGAIGSPQIMQLSGIGAGEHLQTCGIRLIHELAAVGENLQDHLQIRCAYKVSGVPTMNEQYRSLTRRAGFALEYALRRRGPMTMAPSQLGAFTRSDPSRETPNLQYHIQPLTLPKFGEPLDPFPAFTASVCNLRPTSRGHVRITSPEPGAEPEIRANYLATAEDRRVAADSVRVTRRIVSMPSLQKFSPVEFRPGPEIDGDEALARSAGEIATTIFHPVGTARMGSDDQAVVDPRLRVRGIAGLRVIDASVMPTITSGNTNSPTLMIAEKGAAMMLEDFRKGA
ncbi:MAG TPA: GMC family oxidoreductase N-terminal domain-containing protein [Hyphomicrobiaceae bacterium]|nr:GMC family oxidoreductase N-terminal domain-containing protein [Hyphomicrobiaceae bacterium]